MKDWFMFERSIKMANVFNNTTIVAIIIAFSVYFIIRGIAIFFGKAGKGYMEQRSLSTEKLFFHLIGGYYIFTGILGFFIPKLDWKTEDIYNSIGIYALVSVFFWLTIEFMMKRNSEIEQKFAEK
jgi:pilus assembly protein TadC